MDELLRLEHLRKSFRIRGADGRRAVLRAVDDVSLAVARGETLGLVGESGCGKTTLGRTALRFIEPDGGRIFFDGADVTHADMRPLRRKMQIIFQDPAGSLDPRTRVGDAVAEGLRAGAAARRERAIELLHDVGLDNCADRYPRAFSGGQQQRVGIARALAVEPALLVCDEPVSALDVSCQAQIVNLLRTLQAQRGLTYLFISHDLSVVRHLSDRIGVMYRGRLMELGPTEELCAHPAHPYTRELLSAIPADDPAQARARAAREQPAPERSDTACGCPFLPRCPQAESACAASPPPLRDLGSGRLCACRRPL